MTAAPWAVLAAVTAALVAGSTGLWLGYLARRRPSDEPERFPAWVQLGVGSAAWLAIAGVVAADPPDGGTYLALALLVPAAVALAGTVGRTRRLRLRMRLPGLRLALDGLLTGIAITISLWFIVLGPLLVDATELRRVVTSTMLVLTWSTAALAALHVALARSPRSAVGAMVTCGSACGSTLIACAWPYGALTTTDAVLVTAGATLATLTRVIGLATVSRQEWLAHNPAHPPSAAAQPQPPPSTEPVRPAQPAHPARPAAAVHQQVGHDADSASLPTARDLSPSALASVTVTVVLVGTMLFFPVPPKQTVPLGLVVLLMIVFAEREFLAATLREHLMSRLRRQALTDPLTGLTNRRGLSEWLAWVGGRNEWVVVTVDVDGFKQVNEILGYDTADALLATVGRELAAVEAPALASRVAGDEFVVIAPGDLDDGIELGEELRRRLAQTLTTAAHGLPVTSSFGVARMPDADDQDPAAEDPLSVLADSAAALLAAKEGEGDQVVAYAGEVATARKRQQRIEGRLRAMVSQRSVGLAALPVVDLSSGRIEGVEALARWDDKILGPIPPTQFVPIAEQNQLMQPLGDQIFRRALDEAIFAGAGAGGDGSGDGSGEGFTLAVNVSLAQLRRPDFVGFVEESLERTGFPPSRLVVDVPESTVISEDGAVSQTLILLAELGVKIAIDDFGTGYLALSCLEWLPVDQLKVDRRLTETPYDPRTVAVVETVIDIAHEVDLRVVMEGVSSPELADYWRRIGADAGQGYALVPPSPWQSVAALVRDGVRLEAS